MHISIIIVNFNSSSDTITCLASLKMVKGCSFNVVLIDNCSSYTDISNLEFYLNQKNLNYPIDLIKEKANLGFAGGNNVGIRFSLKHYTPDYFLLLNNDTIVEPSFLLDLISTNLSDYSMVTPKIIFNNKRNTIWSAGGYINKKRGIGVNRNYKKKNNDKIDDSREIDFAPFCCVLFKKEVFQKIGFLDESYFMYFEDVDFCYKLKKANIKMYYCAKAKIYHNVSASSGGAYSPFYLEWMTRNRKRFIKGHFSKLVYIEFVIETIIKLLYYLIHLDKPRMSAIIRGFKK